MPVRATLRQDCDEPRQKAGKLLIRPTHGDRAGAGNGANKSHSRHPEMGADQFSGHASVTDASLNPGATEPVDPRLTVSFQPVLTRIRTWIWRVKAALSCRWTTPHRWSLG